MSGKATSQSAIVADRLIDGTGRVHEQVAVVWDGDRLVAAGPRSQVRIPSEATVFEGDDLTILPGLIDCHVHLGTEAGMNFVRFLMTPPSLGLLFAVPNSAATLEAGFTSVRDAGITPIGVKIAIERGFFPGPRMQLAVSILSQTGGHGDDFMPCGTSIPLGTVDIPPGVVDGADAMRLKVRTVLRAGADWIKLCTSGGVLSPGDDPDAAQFTVEEIAAAVQEAAAQGKRCMAHAMSAQGIKNALTAGVATIEHGSFIDEEGIALMKKKDAYLVPTLSALPDVLASAEREPQGIPEAMVEKARRIGERHRQAFEAAYRAGVKIVMGTDKGVGQHGDNARELPLMVAAGLSPMEAIIATTRTPAELLRVADQIGTVEQGKLADLVVVAGDPLADIGLFNDRSRVQMVVKGGRVVRDARAHAAVPSK